MDVNQKIHWKNEIISAILEAANPVTCVERLFGSKNNKKINIEYLKKNGFNKFHLISIGKAAVTMAEGLINHYGDCITGGVIVHKSDYQFIT